MNESRSTLVKSPVNSGINYLVATTGILPYYSMVLLLVLLVSALVVLELVLVVVVAVAVAMAERVAVEAVLLLII